MSLFVFLCWTSPLFVYLFLQLSIFAYLRDCYFCIPPQHSYCLLTFWRVSYSSSFVKELFWKWTYNLSSCSSVVTTNTIEDWLVQILVLQTLQGLMYRRTRESGASNEILFNYWRKAGQQSAKILSPISEFLTTSSCPSSSPEIRRQMTAASVWVDYGKAVRTYRNPKYVNGVLCINGMLCFTAFSPWYARSMLANNSRADYR